MTALDITRAAALDGVPHAFLGRAGGVSTGIYAGLNTGLGSADSPATVRENRHRALVALPGADALLTLHQVHSSRAVAVASPFGSKRPRADAVATRTRGLALGILTADCAPVLLADAHARVIGAAHAGWKGVLGGVIEAVVACMEELGATRLGITAAIGPCIAQASYEVDEAFRSRFINVESAYDDFFEPGADGRHQFNLEGFVFSQLACAGVGNSVALGLDTYANPGRWFSYRRAIHRGEADYGRQLSLIALG